VWQLANTLIPYALLWVLMFFALRVSWWLVVPLAILAGAFLIRTFVIFHDCTHGSFFKSKRANEVTGFLTGLLAITPFHQWRFEHSVHHSAAGDLDRRGIDQPARVGGGHAVQEDLAAGEEGPLLAVAVPEGGEVGAEGRGGLGHGGGLTVGGGERWPRPGGAPLP
jgi:hypothetical protein